MVDLENSTSVRPIGLVQNCYVQNDLIPILPENAPSWAHTRPSRTCFSVFAGCFPSTPFPFRISLRKSVSHSRSLFQCFSSFIHALWLTRSCPLLTVLAFASFRLEHQRRTIQYEPPGHSYFLEEDSWETICTLVVHTPHQALAQPVIL
jgi:hypothetical protein